MTRPLPASTVPTICLGLALLASAAAAQPQLRYRVTEIHPPNAGNLINPPDIDNRGRVAGSTYTGSFTAPMPVTDVAPFLRKRNGAFVNLEVLPGATASTVLNIGQNGTLAGSSGLDFDTDTHAVIWDRRGRVTDLGVLNPGVDTVAFATDIDFFGKVMGASGTLNNWDTTSWLWHRGVFTAVDIPGFPYSELVAFGGLGAMAGNAWHTAQFIDPEGFIMDRHGNVEMIGVLPAGGTFSFLADINLWGTAVGLADVGQPPGAPPGPPSLNAIVYQDGTLTSLGMLPGDFLGQLLAINNWGTAVGISFGLAGPRAVISRSGGALEDLTTMLDPATPANVQVGIGHGINDWGQIVAEAFDPILYPPQYGPPGATFVVLLTPYYK